jgi:hypothetical protein
MVVETLQHVQIDASHLAGKPERFQTESKDRDLDWGPKSKHVRLKRTYGGRPRIRHEIFRLRKSQPYLAPGEILVPTPILHQKHPVPEPDVTHFQSKLESMEKTGKRSRQRYGTKEGETRFQLAEEMRRIKSTTSSSSFVLYEGLYNAVESLMRATSPDLTEERSQTRTLLSTCLRSVPNYIKFEAAWVAAETGQGDRPSAVHPLDISSEVYSDLEALGTSDRGWKHLKTVVRAQGIQLISDAIMEHLVETKFANGKSASCPISPNTDQNLQH